MVRRLLLLVLLLLVVLLVMLLVLLLLLLVVSMIYVMAIATATGRSVTMFPRRFRESRAHPCVPVRWYRWLVVLIAVVRVHTDRGRRGGRCGRCRSRHSMRRQGWRNVVVTTNKFAIMQSCDRKFFAVHSITYYVKIIESIFTFVNYCYYIKQLKK